MNDPRRPPEISHLVRDCSRCVKCGTCQYVCPVFSVRPEESMAPRGKLALVEAVTQGHLDGTSRYKEYLETCLLCGACEDACPNNVETVSIMSRGRTNVPQAVRLRTVKGLILTYLFKAVNVYRYAMRMGRTVQYLLFRRIPASSGMRRRFPMPVIASDRTLPVLAKEFFRDRNKGEVRKGPGPRVGIFTGCAGNFVYTDYKEAILSLLDWLGATVVVPPEQVCCGLPAFAGGAQETAKDLALKNFEVFKKWDLDFIVTGCASCSSHLTQGYVPILMEAGVEKDQAERFVAGIQDINVFLHNAGLLEKLRELGAPVGERPLRVTYHHPCHLVRHQHIREEPEELIGAIPGVEYVPMAEADRCCGLAGSFGVEHYDISKEINDRKIRNIADSGADVVVTSCPGCLLHIRDGLRRNRQEDIEATHIMVLMEKQVRKAREEQAGNGEGEGEEKRLKVAN